MYRTKRVWLFGFPVVTVLALFLALLSIGSPLRPPAMAADRIRKPAVAGYFYPKNPDTLRTTVDTLISRITETQVRGRILGLMSPHAGYGFSGHVAAYAYREVKGKPYDTVVILGPSHHAYLRGASVGDWDAYATPLGRVPVNRELVGALLNVGTLFSFSERAHIREHAVETQLPFLQRVLRDFDIVPIVMGTSPLSELEEISEAIVRLIRGRNILLIASSDMSHFPTYEDANEVDRRTLSVIETLDPERVFNSEARVLRKGIENLSTTLCGLRSVVAVMMMVKELGGNAVQVLRYANSGDVEYRGHKEKRRVVGYGAVAFYKP
ncbi:MAG: AmmeMemoRadiSam system protein B [Deltaproteobacteria bacterium]|nr:AmmeMemoRadiSam system protein B [Deltaproteobacteria bacterium]MBW2078016.1 AmmeMemoRadiSam system protein B [Deltaproteobacteria bacterium]RLB30539.1 MAG: AmmeMemoRadiSam system protein B [Deltaproteobacteria bacterium]